MQRTDSLSWGGIRGRLFALLDAYERTKPAVIKAIPIAFPIVEATYEIAERVPEKVGLVRRYLLDALSRFGPCTPQQLDELLALDADLIGQILSELSPHCPELFRTGAAFAVKPEIRALLVSDQFNRRVTQRRKFVVNGLTDKLLPIDFWKWHDGWRLYVNPRNPEGNLRTDCGKVRVRWRIAGRMAEGLEDLRRLIAGADDQEKQSLGVPAAAYDSPSAPEAVETSWVLAFLLVCVDGSVDLRTVSRQPAVLLNARMACREYLRGVCRDRNDRPLGERILNAIVAPRMLERLRTQWASGIEFMPGRTPNEFLLIAPDPAANLRPRAVESDAIRDPSSQLSAAMQRGRLWDIGSSFVLQLTPGDPGTAAATALAKGIDALRRISRQRDQDEQPTFDLPNWWRGWQRDYVATLPDCARPAELALPELLRLADKVADTEFQDWLERVNRRRPAQRPTAR